MPRRNSSSSSSSYNNVDRAEGTKAPPPPRQWIQDRVHGKCKYDRRPEHRPPCNLCWPSPIVKFFPFLLEENVVCTSIGKIGCMPLTNYKANYAILRLALSISFWGFLCTLYAAISLTDNPKVLKVTAFSRGKVTSDESGVLLRTVELFIGLRGVLIDNPNTPPFGQQFIPFEDFCNYDGIGSFVKEEDCSKCEDAKLGLFLYLLFAIVAYVLAMLGSENLRLFPFYEVNCTRAFGMIYSLISIICSVLLWYFYWNDCFETFHNGQVYFTSGGDQVGPDEAALSVKFSWKVGIGLILLWTGAGLKVISFLLSCIISTPNITRDRAEQEQYETLPYPER